MARELFKNEVDEILTSIKTWEDVTEDLLKSYFAKFDPKDPPRFNTNDYFKLPINACSGNKKSGFTTIGKYIFNKLITEPTFTKVFGYINKAITGPVLEDIEDKISSGVYTDKISTADMADYLDKIQWLGGNDICPIISPSLTASILKPYEGMIEKKEELKKKYKKEIEAGDPIIGAKIEAELVKGAEETLKNDPGFENFLSKAKASVGNNYKNMNIMKGPLANTATGKYQINFSEYNTGISKEEYASTSDSAVAGAFARSTAVAVGGYLASRTHQTLNDVQAAERGSDCGSRVYLKFVLPKDFKDEYLYRYIRKNNTTHDLILLNEDNYDQYAGKMVEMRSALFCHQAEPCFCNKCLGDQPYLFELDKFGLAIARLSNTLLNLQLKTFHDASVKVSTIDPSTLINWKN